MSIRRPIERFQIMSLEEFVKITSDVSDTRNERSFLVSCVWIDKWALVR